MKFATDIQASQRGMDVITRSDFGDLPDFSV